MQGNGNARTELRRTTNRATTKEDNLHIIFLRCCSVYKKKHPTEYPPLATISTGAPSCGESSTSYTLVCHALFLLWHEFRSFRPHQSSVRRESLTETRPQSKTQFLKPCEYSSPVALSTHQEDGAVVVHVQEGELPPRLLQDDENGIHEVKDLLGNTYA